MKIKFVPQDCWVGLYWKTCLPEGRWVTKTDYQLHTKKTWYLCLIPCFPLIWSTFTPVK